MYTNLSKCVPLIVKTILYNASTRMYLDIDIHQMKMKGHNDERLLC
jgi:hypothetical protein